MVSESSGRNGSERTTGLETVSPRTIRSQAIDGVGTYTPRDSQPCRPLQRNGDFSPVDTDSAGYNRQMEETGESRSLRRSQLAEVIKRKRFSLYLLKMSEGKMPSSVRERYAASIQKIAAELEKLEEEFHALNV